MGPCRCFWCVVEARLGPLSHNPSHLPTSIHTSNYQDWLWPAIWLLPEKNAYGQWPASGEIDVMESRGNKPGYVKGACLPAVLAFSLWGLFLFLFFWAPPRLSARSFPCPPRRPPQITVHPPTPTEPPPPPHPTTAGGYDSFGSCMHWGPYFALDSYEMTCQAYTLPKSEGTFNDNFHVFGLYWDEVSGLACLFACLNACLPVCLSSAPHHHHHTTTTTERAVHVPRHGRQQNPRGEKKKQGPFMPLACVFHLSIPIIYIQCTLYSTPHGTARHDTHTMNRRMPRQHRSSSTRPSGSAGSSGRSRGRATRGRAAPRPRPSTSPSTSSSTSPSVRRAAPCHAVPCHAIAVVIVFVCVLL